MGKAVCFLGFFLVSFYIYPQAYNPTGSLLWEIKSNKGTSYIFGTLHSNDKRLFQFPDSVYSTFLSCDKLAIEVNVFDLFVDKDPIPNKGNVLLDKKGRLYTSNDSPTSSYYGNEDGMPQFMDSWFQEKAELLNKPIIALESIAQQTKALEEIPYIETENKLGTEFSERQVMHELYLQGRIDLIDRLIKSGLSANKEAYLELIEKRNSNMAQNIIQALNNGRVFCAVGAGHLYGDKGIVSILRSKGYILRPVSLIKSDQPTTAEIQLKAVKSFEYLTQIGTSQLKFIVPGKPRELKTLEDESTTLTFKELGQGNTYCISWMPRDSSLSLLEYAEILIASPQQSPYFFGILDDGTEFTQGLSDAYPDGLKWVRLLVNNEFVLVASCSGGNKFMNSDRPTRFFNTIILE